MIEHLKSLDERQTPLIMNPEWQRGHVWSESQQIAFVEYFLKGGRTGRDLYFNCSTWQSAYNTPIYCVDGLQRITAMTRFLENEIKAFGNFRDDFGGKLRTISHNFRFNVLRIKNKKELLNIYLDFNSGGTPHNPTELKMVSDIIENMDGTETI